MPLLRIADTSATAWDFVYDEILLEMAVAHPNISELNETTLKTRLLEIIAAADAGACEPADLMRLFRETLKDVGELKDASVGLDL